MYTSFLDSLMINENSFSFLLIRLKIFNEEDVESFNISNISVTQGVIQSEYYAI